MVLENVADVVWFLVDVFEEAVDAQAEVALGEALFCLLMVGLVVLLVGGGDGGAADGAGDGWGGGGWRCIGCLLGCLSATEALEFGFGCVGVGAVGVPHVAEVARGGYLFVANGAGTGGLGLFF